ncbi:hypothetical protein FF38_01274 [Lucilia cuprina]|uniref:Uncharacterized protein n=1 Tax=Lucilia cuprina TaxID=7375 RepID=A0A0L0BUY0_LUCCU|nr:hypothetical protein FF38_01274 [Lucilia cuprina]
MFHHTTIHFEKQSGNSEEDYINQSGGAAEVLAEDSAKDAFTSYETLVAVENKTSEKTFDTGAVLEAETPEYTEYSSIEYVPVTTKKYGGNNIETESKSDSLESALLEGGEEVSEIKDGSAVLRPVQDIKNKIIEDKINTSSPASMDTPKVIDNENGGKVAEDLNLSISDVADKEADGGDDNQDAEEKLNLDKDRDGHLKLEGEHENDDTCIVLEAVEKKISEAETAAIDDEGIDGAAEDSDDREFYNSYFTFSPAECSNHLNIYDLVRQRMCPILK